ncbi:hypothetical protein HID58_086201 [Brassica napus]|uniref:Uncharacterized protein n=1 Tax=Brassica napus TaxID=3708 RepID=A0ABQ7XSM7_BRANA|nr:hypothetical protein HID58_086201 [Brassica napus]
MGLVRRIFSGKVVSRSSGSVYGKKKLLQFFFAGFCFSERWLFFAFSSLFRLCPIKTFCTSLAQLTLESRSCDSIDVDLIPLVPSGEGGCVGCGSSISGESRRNRWVRWSQFPACSVETIGGFVFAGDVFSVPVTVV